MSKDTKLSAAALKNTLWDCLLSIKHGKLQSGEGAAIASQAREILRTVKIQLQISAQSKRDIPAEIMAFSEQP